MQSACPLDLLTLPFYPSVCQKADLYGFSQWIPLRNFLNGLPQPMGVTGKREDGRKRVRMGNDFLLYSLWVGIFFILLLEATQFLSGDLYFLLVLKTNFSLTPLGNSPTLTLTPEEHPIFVGFSY